MVSSEIVGGLNRLYEYATLSLVLLKFLLDIIITIQSKWKQKKNWKQSGQLLKKLITMLVSSQEHIVNFMYLYIALP